jgi:hypothetical protein
MIVDMVSVWTLSQSDVLSHEINLILANFIGSAVNCAELISKFLHGTFQTNLDGLCTIHPNEYADVVQKFFARNLNPE